MIWIFALLFSVHSGWAGACGAPGTTLNGGPNTELIRANVLGRQDVCTVRVVGPGGRIFRFNSRGEMTVTLGEIGGPPVTMCQFRILPTGAVDSGTLNDGTVKSSGIEWRFDASGRLVSSDGCTYELEPSGSEANNCGFRIKQCRGKVVYAWKAKTIHNSSMKGPASIPTEMASIITPTGAKGCNVKNHEILTHQRTTPTASHPLCGKNGAPPQDKCTERESAGSNQAGFDEMPKNKSGGHLASVLTQRCGGDWSFLNGAAINGVGEAGAETWK